MQIEKFAEMFRKQVYSSDVDSETIDDAITITKTQSKKVRVVCLPNDLSSSYPFLKLLEEYGLDFRFLLDKVLMENPQDPTRSTPPVYRSHAQTQHQPDPIYTPASTPVRSRSPASTLGAPTTSRKARTPPPVPHLPTSMSSSPASVPRPLPSPRASPVPRAASPARISSPLPGPPRVLASSGSRPGTPETPLARIGGPRPLRGSPAPPPRSRDRPMSGSNRPPPVAIPKRDGMF